MEQKSIKAGDRVRIKSLEEIEATLDGSWKCGNVLMNKATMAQFAGKEATVYEPHTTGVILDNGWYWHRDWLEPIEEPVAEAAPVDLCELLAGCEGMELYSTVEGPMKLVAVEPNGKVYQIRCADRDGDRSGYTREGYYLASARETGGECVLFPSKEQRDWSKWEKPTPEAWKPEPGEDYWLVNSGMRAASETNIDVRYDRVRIAAGNCFRTREEAEEAAEEVRKYLKAFRDRKR